MDNSELFTVLILIGIFHLFANGVFSKIILEKEPGFRKRALLLTLLWIAPLFGILAIYKVLDLGWFKKTEDSAGSGGLSSGLLEMDAVFNPGARHLIESKQKARVQVQREGEMFEAPDLIAKSVLTADDKK